MVEAVSGGWWYSAFLPEGQLITVFLTDSDLRPHHVELPVAEHTAARLECCTDVSRPFVFSANSTRLSQCVGSRWLAVGDAACALDPLSSQGMMNGMRFGMAAGRAIVEHRTGELRPLETYRSDVQQSFEGYLSIRQHYYRRERRWPESSFWNRRHRSS